MPPRVHIGLALAATLSACGPPTSSSKQATQARSSTAPAPDQAPAPAPPAARVTASGTPKPVFVGARYGSLLVRENAHAIDACLAQARCSVGRFQMTFDVESDGAISDVVLNVVWHPEEVESAKETVVRCLKRVITSFRYSKPPNARTRVSFPVMVDYAIYECKS